MIFVLEGAFIPYVRMTRRGKYVNERAQKYLNSQGRIRESLIHQMQENGFKKLPKKPIRVNVTIWMTGRLHCQDIDNQVKALLDAAKGVVWPDDRWIDGLTVKRGLGGEAVTILEVGAMRS